MTTRRLSAVGSLLLTSFSVGLAPHAHAEQENDRVVRLAELEIDPARVARYKALLQEEISTSIRVEPGVLTLYAVSVKDHPEQIVFLRSMRTQRLMRYTSTRLIS